MPAQLPKPNTPDTAAPNPAAASLPSAGLTPAVGSVQASKPSPEAETAKEVEAEATKVPDRAEIMPPGTLQHADPVQNPPLNTALPTPTPDYVVRSTYPPLAAGQRDQESEHEIGAAGGDVETTAPPR